MQITSNEDLFKAIDNLVNAWCDRRCLKALRSVLQGWPLVSGLSDDWANLYEALRQVCALAKDELTKAEIDDLDTVINTVGKVVYR
jgi:hypothetical protein